MLNEADLEENEYHLVCKRSVAFMRKFKYVHLHKNNPLVKQNTRLRSIMKLRRVVHKLFDQIKCNIWDKIFSAEAKKRSRTLVERTMNR
jgi:hypothetical protein